MRTARPRRPSRAESRCVLGAVGGVACCGGAVEGIWLSVASWGAHVNGGRIRDIFLGMEGIAAGGAALLFGLFQSKGGEVRVD